MAKGDLLQMVGLEREREKLKKEVMAQFTLMGGTHTGVMPRVLSYEFIAAPLFLHGIWHHLSRA